MAYQLSTIDYQLTMTENEEGRPPVRELTAAQRRVLGVLLEKAFTTPEYYPLTLKAVLTGCNQKSNRAPTVNYDEDRAEDTIDELRGLGLAAVIQPASGRSLRYRHYMRNAFSFSEPQLAILTELLLRGRQTLGELRGRASRMVPIDDLATLRQELSGLIAEGYAQASGSLDRRGVEVDHGFYPASENSGFNAPPPSPISESRPQSTAPAPIPTSPQVTAAAVPDTALTQLRADNLRMQSEIEELQTAMSALQGRFDDLCRELGVNS